MQLQCGLTQNIFPVRSKKYGSEMEKISDIYKIIFTKFVNFENNAYLCTRNW